MTITKKIYWNLTNDGEVGSFLKVEIQKVDQIIQSFCRIGSPKKLRPSLFDLRKFYKSEKRTSESFKIYPNVMNGEEFRSFKFLKLSK